MSGNRPVWWLMISCIWYLRHCLYTPAKGLNFKHEMFLLSFMGQQEKEQFKRHEDVFFKTEIIDKMPSSTSWQLLNLLSVFSSEYSTSVCSLSYPCERPDSVWKGRGLASWSWWSYPLKELFRVPFDSHKLKGQHKCWWCLGGSRPARHKQEMGLAMKL